MPTAKHHDDRFEGRHVLAPVANRNTILHQASVASLATKNKVPACGNHFFSSSVPQPADCTSLPPPGGRRPATALVPPPPPGSPPISLLNDTPVKPPLPLSPMPPLPSSPMPPPPSHRPISLLEDTPSPPRKSKPAAARMGTDAAPQPHVLTSPNPTASAAQQQATRVPRVVQAGEPHTGKTQRARKKRVLAAIKVPTHAPQPTARPKAASAVHPNAAPVAKTSGQPPKLPPKPMTMASVSQEARSTASDSSCASQQPATAKATGQPATESAGRAAAAAKAAQKALQQNTPKRKATKQKASQQQAAQQKAPQQSQQKVPPSSQHQQQPQQQRASHQHAPQRKAADELPLPASFTANGKSIDPAPHSLQRQHQQQQQQLTTAPSSAGPDRMWHHRSSPEPALSRPPAWLQNFLPPTGGWPRVSPPPSQPSCFTPWQVSPQVALQHSACQQQGFRTSVSPPQPCERPHPQYVAPQLHSSSGSWQQQQQRQHHSVPRHGLISLAHYTGQHLAAQQLHATSGKVAKRRRKKSKARKATFAEALMTGGVIRGNTQQGLRHEPKAAPAAAQAAAPAPAVVAAAGAIVGGNTPSPSTLADPAEAAVDAVAAGIQRLGISKKSAGRSTDRKPLQLPQVAKKSGGGEFLTLKEYKLMVSAGKLAPYKGGLPSADAKYAAGWAMKRATHVWAKPSKSETGRKLLAVDTNILMNPAGRAALTAWLRHTDGAAALLIPHVVLQELDGLKKGNTARACASRDASRFLEELAATDRAAMRLASVEEEQAGGPGPRRGDERIMDTVRYFQLGGASVDMLTDDRNLALAADAEVLNIWTTDKLQKQIGQ